MILYIALIVEFYRFLNVRKSLLFLFLGKTVRIKRGIAPKSLFFLRLRTVGVSTEIPRAKLLKAGPVHPKFAQLHDMSCTTSHIA